MWLVVESARAVYLPYSTDEQGGDVTTSRTDQQAAYEAPKIAVLGALGDLTLLQDKKLGPTDGFLFQGISITNASP